MNEYLNLINILNKKTGVFTVRIFLNKFVYVQRKSVRHFNK